MNLEYELDIMATEEMLTIRAVATKGKFGPLDVIRILYMLIKEIVAKDKISPDDLEKALRETTLTPKRPQA